ncbi:MAG: mechanosensitive ion channel family protein [Dictyoglomaceae bacterium]
MLNGVNISLWTQKVNIFLQKALPSFLYILTAFIFYTFFNRLIRRSLNLALKKEIPESQRRSILTFHRLLENLLRYAFILSVILILLNFAGLEAKTILASLGIVSFALAFGAQSLVRDFISGFFLLLERALNVGDFVEIGGIEGTVEDISIRSTKLRSFDGTLYVIPNGQINIIRNYGAEYNNAVVKLLLPYKLSPKKGLEIVKEIAERIKERNKEVLDEPKVLGITGYGGGGYEVLVVMKTKAGERWRIERELRLELLTKLEEMELIDKI